MRLVLPEGKVSREIFCLHGATNGTENGYYENGVLNYTKSWKNNRLIKSEYHYSDNGIINTYNGFDLNITSEDNSYCYVAYNNAGNFYQILGGIFSPKLYTIRKDSILILKNNENYDGIKDLYLTVATPPKLKTSLSVVINDIPYKLPLAKYNTVIVPNVFSSTGRYQIAVNAQMVNENKRIVKTDSLKLTIAKTL